ncbi:MAG: DUF302 domain-containing protein [Ignavibacteriae bacterium]|nr:DUF302 domain-containing protein [Ignavibacteriota bacterium]MCB9242204.1 DUF302 domain-containing protein [Ignavibacteriales bacterium]
MEYGISKSSGLGFDETIEKVTEELKKEGFGILTTIDIKETLKNKLGIDTDKYMILGACNPNFAHKALEMEQELGLLLPCNVIVYEKDGDVHVSVMNPEIMSSVTGNEKLAEVAGEVKSILDNVIANV